MTTTKRIVWLAKHGFTMPTALEYTKVGYAVVGVWCWRYNGGFVPDGHVYDLCAMAFARQLAKMETKEMGKIYKAIHADPVKVAQFSTLIFGSSESFIEVVYDTARKIDEKKRRSDGKRAGVLDDRRDRARRR